MAGLRKWVVAVGLAVSVLCSAIGARQRFDCAVTVVDVTAKAVPDAAVVIYEVEHDFITSHRKTQTLYTGRTNTKGQLTASFNCRRAISVMVVARKAGYALGWDTLSYTPSSEPAVNIILDKPLPMSGRVLGGSGQPVVGASVRAQPKNAKLSRLHQSPVYGTAEWLTVRTDSRGHFQFDCFGQEVSADFLVTLSNSTTGYQFTPYSTASCGYEVGRKDICLNLPEPVTVCGQVIDGQGKGISGMTVTIRRDHRDESTFKNDYVAPACITDTKGRFAFEGLPPISHFLSVINTDTSRFWADRAVIVNAADGQARQNVEVILKPGGLLELTLLDEVTQKPVPDIRFYISKEPAAENEWWFSRDFMTGPDGKVKAVLPGGQCRFRFWDDRYQRDDTLTLPMIERGKTVSAEFQLIPTKPLTGTIQRPDGTPAENARVRTIWSDIVRTDKSGAFSIRCSDLREDMFLIGQDMPNNLAAVTVMDNPTESLSLTLQPAKTLVGIVKSTDGNPIPAVRVALQLSGPGYISGCCPEVLTDSSGQFKFQTIPAKLPEVFSFRLDIASMNHGTLTSKTLKTQKETAGQIKLEPVFMSPVNQTLDGVVLDKDGRPVAAVPIFVSGTGQYRQTTATDENGRFQIRRLCEGEIHLQAGIGPEGFDPGHVTARSGDTNVKIMMGQRRRHVPEISIQGKCIPGWDSIQFKKQVDCSGKRLLVCFWDYQQRPSRHGVSELAALKEMVEKKGIEVILIHTEPMSEKVAQWIHGKQTAFYLGSITKDPEAIRKKWGVKSLPWLILTDADHKVTAEGFSVSELEAKVK